jgi:hypothetical protein
LLLAFPLCIGTAFAQTASGPARAQASPSLAASPPSGSDARASKIPLRPENLVHFDYRQAELRWIDQHWQLVAGTVWLKDFGRREADARAALRTIQNLHLTERGTVGTPVPIMEYWLTEGAAPQGFGGNGRVETLDWTSLRVEEVQGQWCVRDNRHCLFAFGPHRDDAAQALAVIRHHGFTHLGSIGPAIPTMTYFLGSNNGLNPSLPLRPAEFKSGALVTKKSPETGATASTAPHPQGESQVPQSGTIGPGVLAPGRQATGTAGKMATMPERLAFDYRQVQLRRDQNDWKLVFGGYVFANFGADQFTAQQALSLFQYYRFTEQFLIGRPVPTFTYFLVAGQAPRGLKFGVPAESFLPESVVVRQVGTQWMVCEGERPLVNFADQQEDARQLALAIQRYRFDHLCRLGSGPGRSLTFLLRAR